MSNLANMRARIARELGRADLLSQISESITSAIEAYQTKRFWFNESRDVTFNTVNGQEFYTSSDSTAIPNLMAIDYVSIAISINSIWHLSRRTDRELDDVSNSASHVGQPTEYAYYNRKIRLYPTPSTTWTMRVAAHIKAAEPANSTEANNVWMTDAERLIRSRAKKEIALHVLGDGKLATAMDVAEDDAFTTLKGRTNRQVGRGRVRPMSF